MNIRNIVLCSLFSALLCVCSWIAVPVGNAVITLQTFALFLCLTLLGGKRGSIVCLVYLLLGGVGLPVFSGFRGGLGMLFGATGGYLMGFLAAALLYWLITSLFGARFPVKLFALLSGLVVCYAFGTFWVVRTSLSAGNALSIGAVLLQCVVPYLLPDIAKLCFSLFLSQRLRRHL